MRAGRRRPPLDLPPSRRRGTDLLEQAAAWVLTSLGLLLVVAALVVGFRVGADGMERVRTQAAERTPVTVELLDDVPHAPTDATTGPPVPMPVRWIGADGAEHTAVAPVTGPGTTGSHVTVWFDRSGQPVTRPLRESEAIVVAVLEAIGLLVAGTVPLVFAGLGVRSWIAARNYARWEREWELVEPVWSGRRE
jgi:hypothetical protein